eukprot:1589622-Amphidinium_carterae.1
MDFNSMVNYGLNIINSINLFHSFSVEIRSCNQQMTKFFLAQPMGGLAILSSVALVTQDTQVSASCPRALMMVGPMTSIQGSFYP